MSDEVIILDTDDGGSIGATIAVRHGMLVIAPTGFFGIQIKIMPESARQVATRILELIGPNAETRAGQ